jgi:Ca2+-binding RTX toxin-like protein
MTPAFSTEGLIMYLATPRHLRLLAILAILVGVLVPTATASAGAPALIICDGVPYDSTDPSHVLYGGSGAFPIVDQKLVVDLSDATEGQVVFWSGFLPFGVTGAEITGSPFGDRICGTSADDIINGRKGNDRIHGGFSVTGYDSATGLGGDQLRGRAGNDLIFNGSWFGQPNPLAALMKGGSGSDTIIAGDGADRAFGNKGNDMLDAATLGWAEGGLLVGGSDNDTLISDGDGLIGRMTTLKGKGGTDSLTLGSDDGSVAIGGAGGDTLNGGDGCDQELFGKKGADTLNAGDNLCATTQWLYGGPSADTFNDLGAGSNHIAYGGSGNDTFNPEDTNGTLAGPQTTFQFTVFGDADHDTINGGDEADVLHGGPGDDQISGDAGGDSIYGGPGNDDIDGGAGTDSLYGYGFGDFDDEVDDGDDTIFGGTDADMIDVGTGTNTAYGNGPDGQLDDVSDDASDVMTGWSSDGVGDGTAASVNTYFGSCDPNFDQADDLGDGVADVSHDVEVSTVELPDGCFLGVDWTAFQTGWDLFDEPLGSGRVVWNPTTDNLEATFILQGARADHTYQVGLIEVGTISSTLFTGDPFGILYATEADLTRESATHDITNWDVGFLDTDVNGDGSFAFDQAANNGSYALQFFVRAGSVCPADNCSVVFETEGTFGTTVTVTIP